MLDRDKSVIVGTAAFVFGASCGLLIVVAFRRVLSGDSSLLIQLAMAIVGTGTVGLMVAVVTDFLTTAQARRMQEAAEQAAMLHLRQQAVHTKQMEVSTQIFQDLMEMNVAAQRFAWARLGGDEDRIAQTQIAYETVQDELRTGLFAIMAVLDDETRRLLHSALEPIEAVVASVDNLENDQVERELESAIETASRKILDVEYHLAKLWGTELNTQQAQSVNKKL